MLMAGVKVVCVVGGPITGRKGHGDEIYPVRGRLYTIRAVNPHPVEGVYLHEIRNDVRRYKQGVCEIAFDPIRFRRVVERKTDISIFQAMLTPSPVTVDAMNVADHAREIVG